MFGITVQDLKNFRKYPRDYIHAQFTFSMHRRYFLSHLLSKWITITVYRPRNETRIRMNPSSSLTPHMNNNKLGHPWSQWSSRCNSIIIRFSMALPCSELIRCAQTFRLRSAHTAFPLFPPSRQPSHPSSRLARSRVKGNEERATLCPFSQFDGNAKARFQAFRGGWMGLVCWLARGVVRGESSFTVQPV